MAEIAWGQHGPAMVALAGTHELTVTRDSQWRWWNARIDGVLVGGHGTEAGAQRVAERFARQMIGGVYG